MSLARKLSVICTISLIAVIMYSAPNANIYAAAAVNDGVTSHTPTPKGIHAAVSSVVNVNNGLWNEFSFRGTTESWGCPPADGSSPLACTPSSGADSAFLGSTTWTLSVPANAHAILTVADAFQKGNNYNVLDGGSSIGTTPAVATDLTATSSDPAVTSLDPTWSSKQFNLGTGSHALDIKAVNVIDPFGGAAYFKVDLACDKGFIHADSIGFVCVKIDIPNNPVGGMGIPIDSTALLLAGVQGSALWMIPAIVIAGAGITIFKLKKKNQGESN